MNDMQLWDVLYILVFVETIPLSLLNAASGFEDSASAMRRSCSAACSGHGRSSTEQSL